MAAPHHEESKENGHANDHINDVYDDDMLEDGEGGDFAPLDDNDEGEENDYYQPLSAGPTGAEPDTTVFSESVEERVTVEQEDGFGEFVSYSSTQASAAFTARAMNSKYGDNQTPEERTRASMQQFDAQYTRDTTIENERGRDFVLTPEAIAEIKDIMSRVKLSYTPAWARNMDDEVWKKMAQRLKETHSRGAK